MASAALFAMAGLAFAPSAQAASCAWNTTNGNWSALANWLACVTGNGNPAGTPGAADTATIGASGVVTVNTAQSILTLNNAGTVNITANFLRLLGPSISNSGSINIGQGSLLAAEGNQTLGGGGSFVFADGNAGNRLNLEAGNITLAAGTSIRGHTGSIGGQSFVGGITNFTNNGTVSADVAGGTITLAPNSAITNNGTLSAFNGGTLRLNSNVNSSGAGQVLVGAGSTVIQNGVAVSGLITVNSGGTFRASNSGGNVLDGVTFAGVLDLAGATSIERVRGGLTLNSGTVNIGQNSVFATEGNQTLGGSGAIVFADGSASNRFNLEAGTLTLGSGVTVRGNTGIIGQQAFVGGTANLINNGTISADVSGGTITLAANGSVINNGTLAAQNGGTLLLNSAITNSPGGQILTGAGSTVVQNGVALNGVITVAGTGTFWASNSGSNFFDGVTLTGVLDLASATGIERVRGGLTLNGGTINIGLNSVLAAEGNQSLGGTGTIVFADSSASNRFNLEAGNVTLGANVVVRGHTGTIGQQAFVGGTANFTNNGTISADVAGGTINLAPNAAVTNNGTLSALNGGTLLLSANVNSSAGAQILAGAGSTVVQNGVTLTGPVNIAGTGTFRPTNSGNNFLDAVTLTGTIDMSGATAIERVSSNLAMNGATIRVGANSVLAAQGDQSFSGTGTIVFADSNASNRFNLEAGTLTLGAGVTVRGHTGIIGSQAFVGGTANLINNGTISADVGGGTITLAPVGVVTNNGTLSAQNGGTLLLNSAVNSSAAGQILAGTGSTVVQNGVTLTGPVNIVGTGTFRPTNSGNNFLNGVTLTGTIDMAGATAIERVTGNLALNSGTIRIGSNSVLATQGNQSITGTGDIVFADGNGSNRFNLEAGNLTLGAGVTLRGNTGTIGGQVFVGGLANLVNNGTISADVAGGTITISHNGSLTGSGTLRTTGGILNVALSGPSTQGSLVLGAAGSVNTNNRNLTLLTDYTNAQAGSGNSFNRRAGIVGTGQILAGGDVGQVITGAGVTGGNTATATLTIGNVRVGSNSYTYTVGASGTSGPAMRGGLQTSVNGGNITDARLGGSGVTAGNYNGGAPAGLGDTRTVTFNAASAGALAPLTGQAINLRSTYDNIADQRLNIVLGAGAAAYNAAAGQIVSGALNFGTVQVGQVVSQNLVIRNSATGPAGFVEDLRAAFGASSGTGAALISGTGGLAGIAAGANSTGANGTMTVTVNTASAGTVNGNIAVNYFSQGRVNGVSNGLGEIGAGSEAYGVAGTINATASVINQASPLINNPSINLGNVRIGSASPTANVSITNVATVAPQAALNASITGGGAITASGSFNLLNPGATNNSALQVGMSTATAGAISGTATVNLVSDASNVGGCAPACQLGLAPQNVNVSGNVYRLASPQLNTPSLTLAARVGGTASGNINVSNTSPDAFTEALRTSAGAAPAGFSVTGSPITVAAQGSGSMGVGLNTSTAGSFGGTVVLSHLSTGVGTTGAADIGVGSSNVSLTGRVYTAAQASTQSAVNFGIVHVGDVVAQRSVSVQNSAAATALNDTLRASIGGTAAPFTNNGGSVSGLAAGAAANTSALRVGLNTTTAGVYSGSASVSLASQNADMADLALATQTVALSGTVNNFAHAVLGFSSGSGSFTRVGNTFTLDFGDVVQGSGPLSANLNVANAVAGPADELDGNFANLDVNDFGYSGFANFIDLAAGATRTGYQVVFGATSVLGNFSDAILLSAFGHNASGYRDASSTDLRLVIRGNVVASGGGGGGGTVPEPSGLFLLAMAAACAGYASRRRSSGNSDSSSAKA